MKSFASALGTRMLEIGRGSNQIHGTADDVMFFDIPARLNVYARVLFSIEDMCLMRIVPLRY